MSANTVLDKVLKCFVSLDGHLHNFYKKKMLNKTNYYSVKAHECHTNMPIKLQPNQSGNQGKSK